MSMSEYASQTSGDIGQFLQDEIDLQQKFITELRVDIEENGNSGFKKGYQLKRHIDILLLMKSSLEGFI